MTYKDFVFPQELRDEITATINRASDDAVISFVNLHPGLKAGGRPVKSSCPLFRKKIIQHIRSMKELDNHAAEFLYEAGLGQTFVVVLSYNALKNIRYELSSILGHTGFALALLLDSRDTVRGLGMELIASETEHICPEDAREIISVALGRFNRVYATICGMVSDKTVNMAAEPDTGQESERRLKSEVKRNVELSERLKTERESLTRQIDLKSSRIDTLAVELEQNRRELALAKSEIEILKAERDEEKQGRDTAISDGIGVQLQRITNRWLVEREALDMQVSGGIKSSFDLLAEADQAIERQAVADRHTGNRRHLRERLSAVTAKLNDVREARISALHPIDGLAQIEARLLEEERHLVGLLDTASSDQLSPMTLALAARISGAKQTGEIHHLEEFCSELFGMGLMQADMAYLQKCFCDRYDRFVAEHGDREVPIIPINPALRFRAALCDGKRVALFCDGHNLLNCMEYFRDVCSRSHSDARNCLTESVVALVSGYAACSAYIVFDGPQHNREGISDNLTVIYSGGGKSEKHRADKRIEEMLNWHAYTGQDEQVFVVSADYDVAQDARNKGAEVIPLEQFGWLLK